MAHLGKTLIMDTHSVQRTARREGSPEEDNTCFSRMFIVSLQPGDISGSPMMPTAVAKILWFTRFGGEKFPRI